MPTYREIADDLAARIGGGGWPPLVEGKRRLPTTQDIADTYGVSEATAYRALVLLTDRGIVYGEPGRARFVAGRADDNAADNNAADNSADDAGNVTDVG